jgi:hypothetical protein
MEGLRSYPLIRPPLLRVPLSPCSVKSGRGLVMWTTSDNVSPYQSKVQVMTTGWLWVWAPNASVVTGVNFA